jgi:hypothetical protein
VKNPPTTSETANPLEPIILAPKEKAKDDNRKANPRIPHVPWATANQKNPAGNRVEKPIEFLFVCGWVVRVIVGHHSADSFEFVDVALHVCTMNVTHIFHKTF